MHPPARPAILPLALTLLTTFLPPALASSPTLRSTLVVNMRADLYGGVGAQVQIGLNGRTLRNLVAGVGWDSTTIVLPRKVQAADEIEIRFSNDARGLVNKVMQDRNLRLGSIRLDGTMVKSNQTYFDAGSTWARALDGQQTTLSTMNLLTNGALRFSVRGVLPTTVGKTIAATPTPKPLPGAATTASTIPTVQKTAPAGADTSSQPSASARPMPATGPVDHAATASVKALFTALRTQMSGGVMFGHQEDLTQGATVARDPWSLSHSDTQAATGKLPAVIGWDGTSLTGQENLGVWGGTPEQSAPLIAAAMVKADSMGMLNTMSWHAPNFVTGGRAQDTTGAVVSQIMPGGPRYREFTRYLDAIAAVANGAKRQDGSIIPIIFRPWHEANGNWFWWGTATDAEKVALWRFTITYLRDTKQVHNFLYAWSPSGGFWGDSARYLTTYPGDDFVDILGIDTYDNSGVWDQASLTGTMKDLAMVTTLADHKGKVAALTEFGPGVAFKPSGNPAPRWYTTFLEALKRDPEASRIAYALTWSNWDRGTTYVPTPGDGENASDVLPDFQRFAKDSMIVFAPRH